MRLCVSYVSGVREGKAAKGEGGREKGCRIMLQHTMIDEGDARGCDLRAFVRQA